MKNAFLIVLLFSFFYCSSQQSLEKLRIERDSLLTVKISIEEEIKKNELKILTFLDDNGYEITLERDVEVTEKRGYGENFKNLKKGEKVLIYGKEGIYYKVKPDDRIGYIFLPNLGFPFSLKNNVNESKSNLSSDSKKSNTQNFYSKTTRSSSPSTKGCSASQCSGRTKKGSRCRNRTTNCSGRCHLH